MGTYVQIHQPQVMAEYASMIRIREFIADEVVPVGTRTRKLVKFPKFERRDLMRITDARVAPTGMPNERKFDVTYQQMEVKPYALADKIPISDLNDPEPGIDLEMDTFTVLTQDLLLSREKRIADLIMNPAVYGPGNKITLTTPFTDKVNSTPIEVIQAAKRACALPPNLAVCDEVTFDALAAHPDIVAYLRGIGGAVSGLASADELARYFGLERWLIGRQKYDAASNPGQALDIEYVWPEGHLLIARTNPNPGEREAVLARTLRYIGDGEFGVKVTSEVDNKPGSDGVLYCKVAHEEVSAIVSADCGYLINGAV